MILLPERKCKIEQRNEKNLGGGGGFADEGRRRDDGGSHGYGFFFLFFFRCVCVCVCGVVKRLRRVLNLRL